MHLPKDAWMSIFLFCDLSTIATARRTCKRFNDYCSQPRFVMQKLRDLCIRIDREEELDSFYGNLPLYFPRGDQDIARITEPPRFRIMFMRLSYSEDMGIGAIELFLPDTDRWWYLDLRLPWDDPDTAGFETRADMLTRLLQIPEDHHITILAGWFIERVDHRMLLEALDGLLGRDSYRRVLSRIWLLDVGHIAYFYSSRTLPDGPHDDDVGSIGCYQIYRFLLQRYDEMKSGTRGALCHFGETFEMGRADRIVNRDVISLDLVSVEETL